MNLGNGKSEIGVASLNEVERSLEINDEVCMRDLFELAALTENSVVNDFIVT